MELFNKCLTEWNAIIEALGHGQQSILVRKYNTNLKEFILYPTISYAHGNYLESFKDKYRHFVEENSFPNRDGKKMEVKYFARVESVVEKPITRIGGLSNLHIWTDKHIKSYFKNQKPYVWILRVYKLKEPNIVERTRGLKYAHLLKEVSLDGMKPVLTDSEFAKIVQEIGNKK